MTLPNYPILEFDPSREPLIYAKDLIEPLDNGPKVCVITFFRDVLEQMVRQQAHQIVFEIISETVTLPVYQISHKGVSLGLVQGYLGAAASATMLEELIALGFEKFIVCGGAGVLKKDLVLGHLVVPTKALRDEGTSYHYLKPSRFVSATQEMVDIITSYLSTHEIPYLKGATWTTDALYRETPKTIDRRKKEGCLTVEMEAVAFFAVAKYHGVAIGQMLYAGDDVSREKWDGRQWQSREDIRKNLVDLALEIACTL